MVNINCGGFWKKTSKSTICVTRGKVNLVVNFFLRARRPPNTTNMATREASQALTQIMREASQALMEDYPTMIDDHGSFAPSDELPTDEFPTDELQTDDMTITLQAAEECANNYLLGQGMDQGIAGRVVSTCRYVAAVVEAMPKDITPSEHKRLFDKWWFGFMASGPTDTVDTLDTECIYSFMDHCPKDITPSEYARLFEEWIDGCWSGVRWPAMYSADLQDFEDTMASRRPAEDDLYLEDDAAEGEESDTYGTV